MDLSLEDHIMQSLFTQQHPEIVFFKLTVDVLTHFLNETFPLLLSFFHCQRKLFTQNSSQLIILL